jgi:hypothetical protein
MALRQAWAERGGARRAPAGAGWAGCGARFEVPPSFLNMLQAGLVSSALTRP